MELRIKTAIYGLLALFALSTGLTACKKDKPPVSSTLTTNAITENLGAAVDASGLIVYPNAKSGGDITSDGGSAVTESGICWSTTNAEPTTADNKLATNPLIKTGSFTLQMQNLLPATKYYVRAYATNAVGTAYGTVQQFTTVGVADADGNVYNTIVIGQQTWMLENLKTTKYNDGSSIPAIGKTGWANLATDAYCWYDADAGNKDTYGALYNWYAANNPAPPKKLAPTGWHIPTLAEWQTLAGNNLSTAANKLKEKGTAHWASNSNTVTNSTGFTALPGGLRLETNDSFLALTTYAYYWIAGQDDGSKISYVYMVNNSGVLSIISGQTSKNLGLSVRCVKDL